MECLILIQCCLQTHQLLLNIHISRIDEGGFFFVAIFIISLVLENISIGNARLQKGVCVPDEDRFTMWKVVLQLHRATGRRIHNSLKLGVFLIFKISSFKPCCHMFVFSCTSRRLMNDWITLWTEAGRTISHATLTYTFTWCLFQWFV